MLLKQQRLLILGCSGMLGSATLRVFSESEGFQVYGTVRSLSNVRKLPDALKSCIVPGIDFLDQDSLIRVFNEIRPDIVINCIGLVKQREEADDPLLAIPVNALLPHRLARLCQLVGARLVHMSTDCVFSGRKGMYTEQDIPEAHDLYGRSKSLGEVDYPWAVTLRTSLIGHELEGSRSLIGWFLAQQSNVKGFRRAIFSGLPTVEMARLIRDYVIPNPQMHGIYHVSADPIDKFTLLSKVAQIYGKDIEIVVDEQLSIDRSLDSSRFRLETGFLPKSWDDLICSMHDFG
jgi:dTDP-4-dehydrorhamnose reductase